MSPLPGGDFFVDDRDKKKYNTGKFLENQRKEGIFVRNTLKLLMTSILTICLLAGFTLCTWADASVDEKILAEYNRLMEAEAGDAVDAFLNSLTQPQKNNLMLVLDAMQTEKAEPVTSGPCGELAWSFADGTLTISGTGAMPDFDLAEPAPWFGLREQITEVNLESGVTGVGSLAFLGCTGMSTAKIPNGVKVIGGSAFFGCGKLDGVLLPASLKSLDAWAFSECESLSAISIPGSVAALEEGTFAGCTALQSVVLSNGLETIGAEAFADCAALQNLLMPKSVTSIGSGACRNCSGLAAVAVPENVTQVEADTFAGCSGLKSVTLSRNVTAVGANAFRGCTGLTHIALPVALETIDVGAFSETGLTRIDIHENTARIGAGAFENCAALKDATLAEGVKTIEGRAFAGSGLEAVRFAGSAPEIAGDAFADVIAEASYPCADAKWAEVTAAVALNWKAEHPARDQETVEAVEASCDEPGCTAGTRCTVCGAMLTGETIEPLGHDFADGLCARCGLEEPVIEEEAIILEMPVIEDEEPIASKEVNEETESEETAEVTEATEEAEESEETAETEEAEALEENEETEKIEEPEEEPAPARIYAETVLSHPGKKVDVAVCMENNPGVVSVSLNIRWDAEALKLLEVEDTGLLGGAEHKPTISNPYRLTWANDALETNVTENGTLVILHFEAAADLPAGTYPIHVSYDAADFDIYDCQLNPVAFETEDGGVEIGDVLPGDINSDGKVNNIDRALLTRYLAGWEFPEGLLDLDAADLNGDGKVNNVDRAILARSLAGWEQYQ